MAVRRFEQGIKSVLNDIGDDGAKLETLLSGKRVDLAEKLSQLFKILLEAIFSKVKYFSVMIKTALFFKYNNFLYVNLIIILLVIQQFLL